MHTKEIEAEYTYNHDLDVVNIEVEKEYSHKCSVELSFGVFLDFDVNNFPVNLEMVSASKIVGCKKECLTNPSGNVIVIISEDLIKVDIVFEFENTQTIHFTTFNDLEIPSCETLLALV